MEIIYSGGYDKRKEESVKSSYFYKFSPFLDGMIKDGKKVALVTMAKEDGHYDELVNEAFREKPEIIGHSSPEPDWSQYDAIVLCGGDTPKLKEGLLKKNFTVGSLRDNVIVIGDSAGAMLMAPYFYDSNDRVSVDYYEGIYPEANAIVLVHANNPKYSPNRLKKEVEKFAKENEIELVVLNENEQKRLNDKGEFVDLTTGEIFTS